MQKSLFIAALVALSATLGATGPAHAQMVYATIHGIDLGERGEAGGGPLYEGGTANGNFEVTFAGGAIIVTIHLETWHFADSGHVVACGSLTVVKNDIGAPLPSHVCTSPVPISGLPVNSDFDGDGRDDHKEWVGPADS